jgi:phosphatidylglycerol---prolipoprotein diacylglyceryl transferase
MKQVLALRQQKYWILGLGACALVLVFLFAFVLPGTVVLPQTVGIGSARVHIYGLCLALAVGVASWVAKLRAEKYNISASEAENLFVVVVLSGFIGARLYHGATSWQFYMDNPLQIIAVWKGGLSIFGAIIGALIGIALYLRWFLPVLSLRSVLDWLAPSVAIGQAIGRFGNLFNYEAYGYPTALPWKMFIPPQFRTPPYELQAYVHPLFLYESIGCALIALILLSYKRTLSPGVLFFGWLLLYNVMRFFTEMLRIDSTFIGSLRLNMIMSAALIAVALTWLYYLYVYKNPSHH